MHTLLVTVDYLHESLDLGLPAEVPISEFLPTLLELCGLAQQEAAPPSEDWELALYGGATLPATSSLQNCGVIDGMRLALQNLGTLETVTRPPISGQGHMFPYSSASLGTEGPRMYWVHEDLFNE
jgi:hypothetical protein